MACHTSLVPQEAAGLRVDAYLNRYAPEIPPAVVMMIFRRRDVKVDGVRVRQDTRLRAGSTVQAYYMETEAAPLSVVYEDADVLLLDKRAGMSVLPDGGAGLSLLACAEKHVGAPVYPVHRLDHQTCGLVLMAKTPAAEAALLDCFRSRSLDKRYLCLVRGRMKPPAATCEAFLLKDADAARVRILDRQTADAKPITTAYETIETNDAGSISRLRVHLITGRTHQIRAHLAALGHPLLGDEVYGDHAFNRLHRARRLMLCAYSLSLDTHGALPRLDGRTFYAECPF